MRPRYADLFRRMRDPDPILADAAFDAVLFDRAEAIPDLMECYEKSRKDPVMRFLCVQLLGFTESIDALPTLLAALSDKSALVRAEACRSLEDVRQRDVIPMLEERLHDVDDEVRIAAAEALASIR
ncbi:MAG: HEAT repeat domain-containing protein [Myxococcota bacterium]